MSSMTTLKFIAEAKLSWTLHWNWYLTHENALHWDSLCHFYSRPATTQPSSFGLFMLHIGGKNVYGACEKLCCQHVFLVLLLLPIVYFHSNHGDFIKHVSQLCSALMYPVGSDHTWGKIQTQYHHLLCRCYLTWPSHLSELGGTTLYLIAMEWVPFLCNIWSPFTLEHYYTPFFCLKLSSSYLNMASSLT